MDVVLRRAAEIEARRSLAPDASASEEMTPAELVRLGEEAGLGAQAVMTAIGELERGALEKGEAGALSRTLGSRRLVISREIPGPAPPVQRAVERFMREQLMTIRRHHGDRIEWERAQGLWPGLARSLDFARRYAFGPVSRVATQIIEGEGTTSVTFDVDLSEMRSHRLASLIVRASAAFAIVGLGGTVMFPGFGVNDVIALFSGGALAGGFAALERRRYHEMRERIALAPERFCDLLVARSARRLPAPSDTGQ